MRWKRIGFFAAFAVQCWALYVPRPPSVESGLPLDKVVHVGVFALVTWLGLVAGYRWVVPLMIVQAAASELVHLYFLPSRGGDWWDLTADLVGVGVGVLAARVIPLTLPRTKGGSGISVP